MARDSIRAMAWHGFLIGLAAFLYMGFFGHALPGRSRGPFLTG